MVLYCSNHRKPTQWCSTLSPHPCSIPLSTHTNCINLSVGPENQKQKVTHYEFIADYYLHPDRAEKGVYVNGCTVTKPLCFFTWAPCLKSLCSLTSSMCSLLKHFPHGQTCLTVRTVSPRHPHWPLGGSGQCRSLVPEALTTSNLIANLTVCNLSNSFLPGLPFPLLKMQRFLRCYLWPLPLFPCERLCSLKVLWQSNY